MDEARLREDLVLACRVLGSNGQGDSVFGHVSARLPGWDRCWMKASGIGIEEVTLDDLVLIDFAGKVLEGKRTRHIEYPIHTEIMRARPEVTCVVHTHPTHSVVFAARGLELRPVGHEGAFFWPPGVPTFTEFSDLVRTRAQGEAVTRALGAAKAVFLRNHGIAVADTGVALATVSALMLERAAAAQLLAQPTNESRFTHTPEDEADRKKAIWEARAVHAMWDYYVRKLGRA